MNINLTWQRINCKQEAIPLLISVGVREAEALIAESRSKWDTRLYVNCAMFSCGSSAPLASWATSLRNKPAQTILHNLFVDLFYFTSW